MKNLEISAIPVLILSLILHSNPAFAKHKLGDAKVWQSADFQKCNIFAMSQERDAVGLNVRSGPGVTYPVLGSVPPSLDSEGGLTIVAGPQFEVTGSQNGWFQVNSIGEDAELTGKPARKMFLGKGWVSARKLFVNLQSTKGFARPDQKSEILSDLEQVSKNAKLAHGYSYSETLVGCKDEWALIEHSYVLKNTPKKTSYSSAWFRGICDHFETTCDGLASDN